MRLLFACSSPSITPNEHHWCFPRLSIAYIFSYLLNNNKAGRSYGLVPTWEHSCLKEGLWTWSTFHKAKALAMKYCARDFQFSSCPQAFPVLPFSCPDQSYLPHHSACRFSVSLALLPGLDSKAYHCATTDHSTYMLPWPTVPSQKIHRECCIH